MRLETAESASALQVISETKFVPTEAPPPSTYAPLAARGNARGVVAGSYGLIIPDMTNPFFS